jgi:DNA-binding transcriptional regulator YhcF (GntR family)
MPVRPPALDVHTPVWKILKQFIEERISIGTYPVGSWLPSVRELAAELRVNRNTVSKVFQALAREGTLRAVRGAGVYVERLPTGDAIPGTNLTRSIEALVREARRQGVEAASLIDKVARLTHEMYGAETLRIGFVECSARDTQIIADDLSRHVGLSITSIVLDDLLADPGRFNRGFDLVCTTFFHLQEVSEHIDSTGPELVGIQHTPSHESSLEVARLPRDVTVGIVCTNARTLDRVQSMVRSYIQANVLACTTDDREVMERIARDAQVIVDTVATHDSVLAMVGDIPTITVLFHTEQQSIEFLQTRIRELLARRSLALQPAQPPPGRSPYSATGPDRAPTHGSASPRGWNQKRHQSDIGRADAFTAERSHL